MDIALLVIALISSFSITYLVSPSILDIAHKKRLFDDPDARKVHTQQVPSLGGVAIFIGTVIGFGYLSGSAFTGFRYLMIAYLILFAVGLKDDLVVVATFRKLLVQLSVAVIAVLNGIRITTFHGLFGIETLHPTFSFLLSIFVLIGVMNAFNLIDGVDGLAAGLGIINCLTFGIFLYAYGDIVFAMFAFVVVGALLAFLRYNFSEYPRKMFMGDSGSLFVGLTVAALAIRFLESEAPASCSLNFAAPPMAALAIMIIPVFDVFRVMSIRISKGLSPFHPDRNHLHHLILNLGFTHKATSMILCSVNIVIVMAVLFGRGLGFFQLLFLIVLVGGLSAFFLSRISTLIRLDQIREI